MNAVARHRRPARSAVGLFAVATLVAAGMVSLPASPAAADIAPLPPEADVYLVSRTDQGVSGSPYLTPDGQKVVFVSTAEDLAPGTAPETPNVFFSTAIEGSGDPFSGAAQLVSAPDASLPQTPANDMSYDPVASADGRFVAFVSHATNLIPGGSTAGRSGVYVRDMLTGATTRVDPGVEPDGDSYDPDLSDDGRYLVFTSEATNLWAEDTNGAPDVFVADLDPAGDGARGAPSIRRLSGGNSIPGGLSEPAISGNGEHIVVTAHVESPQSTELPTGTPSLFLFPRGADYRFTTLLKGAHEGDLDATGREFAAIADDCGGAPAAVVGTLDRNDEVYITSVGTTLVDRRVGEVHSPAISADGSAVAYATTQPVMFSSPDPAALAEPVIRVSKVGWLDATRGDPDCVGEHGSNSAVELAAGGAPSLSATGRTVALAGPSDMSGAPSAVVAIDTHSHDGLSVTETMGQLSAPGFITSADISDIPASAVADYAAALANAPIYRLPIYRLPIYRLPIYRLPIYRLMIGDSPIYRLDVADSPIYRLPIYRLPIYRLPIYRLDIPGGWTELLAGTKFAGDLAQSVLLADVLEWANELLAGEGGDPAERAAAQRIQSLTLSDVGLEGTGIDALSLASMVLGGAALGDVEIDGTTGDAVLKRWQDIVDAQGLAVTLDELTTLAELDAAGLAVDRSGVDAVIANTLPVDDTLLDGIPLIPASDGTPGLQFEGTPLGEVDVTDLSSAAYEAIFGEGAQHSGTLAENVAAILPTATTADLAAGAPDEVTLGTILLSLLESADYPWEQIDPAVIPADAPTEQSQPGFWCNGEDRCGPFVQYQFSFDPGPGQPTVFRAPTASIQLPGGTLSERITSGGSGPSFAQAAKDPYEGPVLNDGSTVTFPLPDTAGGTVREFTVEFTELRRPGSWQSRGTLTSGDTTAETSLFIPLADEYENLDAQANNRTPEGTWVTSTEAGGGVVLRPGSVYYEWVTPYNIRFDEDANERYPGPADDEDWFLVDPPAPGKRLVISTNASDGQLAIALFKPTPTTTPLGVGSQGAAPGREVAEQNSRDAGAPAESGADAAASTADHVLVDQASVGGDGTATVEGGSATVDGTDRWLVRVTSGTGEAGKQLYSLRAAYEDEAPEQSCPAFAPPVPLDPEWTPPLLDEVTAVTAATNTLYVTDITRMRQLHGKAATDEVEAALRVVDEWSALNEIGVDGALVPVDADPAVQVARAALDLNPCSMSARRALAAAINVYLATVVQSSGANVQNIVVLGGDDVIPFAPVAQNTAQFNESGHAAELRLDTLPDGSACPPVVAGSPDPCATPLSAAAAGDYILTDDPYGLADAYQTLGGYLYVPTVALGRLVDAPQQIVAQLDRYRGSMTGLLEADTSLTAGYGAWAELPDLVTSNLSWRLPGDNSPLTEPWTEADAVDRLFPTTGDAPRIVSLNTHADERNLLPGIPDAPGGAPEGADLLSAEELAAQASRLEDSLVFMIGCHAGNSLPTSYYGDTTDWTDVFGNAAGYVGNTGFGLANNVTTALSERLLGTYADWIGVETDDGGVSAGEALMFAKQSYLGQAGTYSGYDEKVLMQAVYYGVPMYGFVNDGITKKAPPLPPVADGLSIVDAGEGLASASLTLTPTFATRTVDPDGSAGAEPPQTFLTVGEEAPLAVAGQPALPKTVMQVPLTDGAGKSAKGVLITGLTSEFASGVTPLVVDPGIGVEAGVVTKQGVAFPSAFASVTAQDTPTGPVGLLVVTPASVQAAVNGIGRIETFTSMDVSVLYGDDSAADSTAPVVVRREAGWPFRVSAYDPGDGDISRVVLLVQQMTDGAAKEWIPVDLTRDGDEWEASQPEGFEGPFRWILQVVDAAGNVTTDSDRGRLPLADQVAPTLADGGETETAQVGDRVVRGLEIGEVEPGDALSGSFRLLRDGDVVQSGPLLVETGADGVTRAVLDLIAPAPGTFTVELKACRPGGSSCSDPSSFELTVTPDNTAPAATVHLADAEPTPSSTLYAAAEGTDADGDTVRLSYRWYRNGILLETADEVSLVLTGIATPGDVIRVVATPNDGATDGHAAFAEVVVGSEVPLPTIEVDAVSDGVPYAEGAWATDEVLVSFACTGTGVVCPDPVTVTTDTPGTLISRTVTDTLGREATTAITVTLDRTPPALAPVVTPDPVAVGGTATARAGATDTGSGIAEQSCDTPVTTTAGSQTLSCQATDTAGNTSTATATYTVVAPSAACRSGSRVVLQPVNPDGSSVFARISAVPVIFRLCDSLGQVITAKGSVTAVTPVSATALPKKGVAVNELPLLLPTVKPVYVPRTGLWAGAIGSLSLTAGQKYTYRVSLADGTSFTFTFGIK
ncbi:C25 family cysteine peptidase [Microbacterium sp. CFBP9034]|uniref:C25 family cysteine peptidase n=1 Tax=Microbacterium sp. CFBP9034 TaxID=3096540 RepID=UPI002A6A4819|nr:C25 family cysteine peptidase [Microbacterium sp. CFBP9034]MDY0908353.1 C25 family cysteine peptidase [Microbacterium sp. CFBP9034]